ncbi:GbsR/MarR family transcriptional regulator [Bacillus marinisedimentorum]|uniref:GbsR/MarR family transcriptional regulator n=1 Tax=Bacillus marinisedimentorum TaxID=1821260 RepID=UPI0007DEC69E|nr:transcriptional regulator [Bacillus marinisedimentorum]
MNEQQSAEEWGEYEELKEKFIQIIASNMGLYGLNQSIGRLYGTMYFAGQPMTLDDMREALHMSKTSMSTGVRTLQEMKMVEPVFKKGIRKDLYQTSEDWYQSFMEHFSKRWKSGTRRNVEEAEKAIKKLTMIREETDDSSLTARIDEDIEKLDYAAEYYSWLLQFIEVVETGKIFDFIPRPEQPRKRR